MPNLATKAEVKPDSEQERYSFSKLSCFNQCKYQFKLKYRTPKDERPKERENAFSQYGIFVHELLEKYEKKELAEYELAPKYEDEFDVWVTEEFPPNAYVNLQESYYNAGLEFLSNYEGQGERYTVLGVEKYFTVEIDGIQLRGFIDLILRDNTDGGIIVHDWKSKSAIKTKADKKKYGRQLYLYSTYIKQEYGVWPKMLRLYLFRKDMPVDIPFKEDEYDEAVEWMKSQVEAIKVCEGWDDYTYDQFFCANLCEFRDSCKWRVIEESACQQGGNP